MHLTPALLSTGWGWVGSGSERPSTATWPHIRLPCSAGGTGVLLNVDRVAEQLQELGYPAVQVRGLADSGWFLDNKQYRGTDCIDTITCAPTEAIRRGIRCTCWDPFQGAGTHAEGLRWAAPGGGLTCSVWPRYWKGVVPERCRRQFQEGEEWNCFFGYKVYPTLHCEWPPPEHPSWSPAPRGRPRDHCPSQEQGD